MYYFDNAHLNWLNWFHYVFYATKGHVYFRFDTDDIAFGGILI